jgi:hypothetical protein
MQKDIYAIYEAYITEDGQGQYSQSTTPPMPGFKNPRSAAANNTSSNGSNLPSQMSGVAATRGNLSPSGALNQDEETKEHKSLNREVAKLSHLARTGKYQDVVMYCKSISKLAEDAYNKTKK